MKRPLTFVLTIFTFLAGCTNAHFGNDSDAKEDAELWQDALFGPAFYLCTGLDRCFDRFADRAPSGANIQIINSSGTLVYERWKDASLTKSTYQPIFSASKWMTAAVIMAITEDASVSPALTLDTTTGDVLGWTGTQGTITMRQLLAFTSGLRAASRLSGSDECISSLPDNASDADKDACIESIRTSTAGDSPGAYFVYNSNHMAVAQRMAEIRTGLGWTALFNKYLGDSNKLAFDGTQARWYANVSTLSGDGSLAGAYGLVLTSNEYMRFMIMLMSGGTYNGNTILSQSSIDTMLADQYESNTQILYSQFAQFGFDWHYGLGNWRVCFTALCSVDSSNHSFGANGFYPFLDRGRGYAVVIGTILPSGGLIPAASQSLFYGEDVKRNIGEVIR